MCPRIYELYLDTWAIKSLGAKQPQQESDPLSPAALESTRLFQLRFCSMKMTKDGVSLRALNKTLNRVENKVQTLETQFKDLQSSLDNLTHKFEQQAENLENQMSLDAMWTSALEDSGLTSAETSLLLSYACETLVALRCLVTAEVPDLAQGLATTAHILRRKARHGRIRAAWDAALQRLELREDDVAALGAFLAAHGHEARPCAAAPGRWRQPGEAAAAALNRAVRNERLRAGLLRAVKAVDEERARRRAESADPAGRAPPL